MITADQIDHIFDVDYETETNQEKLMKQFTENQVHLSAWLLSDHFDVLTEAEQDYLYFLALTIWLAHVRFVGVPRVIDGDEIREAEEKVWELLESAGNLNYEQKMDLLFAHTDEEDLLAFVEDSLADDPEESENIMTPIGREPMAVALKTIIDVFSQKEDK